MKIQAPVAKNETYTGTVMDLTYEVMAWLRSTTIHCLSPTLYQVKRLNLS